jgi:hypothetical protein
MCVVSFVGGHYEEKWKDRYPEPVWTNFSFGVGPSQMEFDQLKKEVAEMKELLRKAKIYDEVNNEKDCEMESKMEFLRKVAKLVGVDLDDVLKGNPPYTGQEAGSDGVGV